MDGVLRQACCCETAAAAQSDDRAALGKPAAAKPCCCDVTCLRPHPKLPTPLLALATPDLFPPPCGPPIAILLDTYHFAFASAQRLPARLVPGAAPPLYLRFCSSLT